MAAPRAGGACPQYAESMTSQIAFAVAAHRSSPLFQYSNWAERTEAARCLLSGGSERVPMRVLMDLHARSMIWAPALALIVEPSGNLWVADDDE